MALIHLSEIQDENLASSLTLGVWSQLSVKDMSLNPKKKQEQLPSKQQQTCYLLAFGGELSATSLRQISGFLKSQHLDKADVCYYQPIESLQPALIFRCKSELATLKSQLPGLSEQLGCQLSVFQKPPTLNKPGLLVMDMDSTAITIECIDEIARLGGVYDEVASVTAQAMNGELAFSESLRLRVAKLGGIETSLIDKLKQDLPLMPGVLPLCKLLKSKNWQLAIASGGFIVFARRVQQLLGLDFIHANALEIADNKLTGKVSGLIVDADEKARFLRRTAKELNIDIKQTLAMGDGANDLKMLATAALGVAVHGKPKVVEKADVAINEGSLLQIAYFIDIPQ